MHALARKQKNVDYTALEDFQLLKQVLRENQAAWNEFMRRYRPLIFRCIGKVTNKFSAVIGNADVDEIFAEVLVLLVKDNMKKLRAYNPKRGTKLSSWVGMISINAAYDYLRASARRPMLDRIDGMPERNEENKRTPLDDIMEKERWSHLNEILSDFSDKDREFIDLYYAKGMSPADVADHMSISLKTVYSKKHKIREHLKKAVEGFQGDSPIADLANA